VAGDPFTWIKQHILSAKHDYDVKFVVALQFFAPKYCYRSLVRLNFLLRTKAAEKRLRQKEIA